MTQPSQQQVLLVGPSWVGDMVMAQSAILRLFEAGLAAQVDVLAPAWSLPLIRRMTQVRSGVQMPLKHGELALGTRWQLGKQLRERGYDRAIILPRSAKAALVPYFARIPVRTGFRGEMRYGLINDMRALDKSVLSQTVQRFVALADRPTAAQPPAIPPPRLEIDEQKQRDLIARFALSTDGCPVALMPGAEYGPAKCWPHEHFAELARLLVARGQAVWVLGSQRDRAAGEKIVAAAGSGVVNLCGRTELEDAIDLLGLAWRGVSNDSGLMHVCAAVGTPVVALYGSTSPGFTPPLSDSATVLYRGLSCSPCFARECPLTHLDCLRGIAVAEVLAALGEP